MSDDRRPFPWSVEVSRRRLLLLLLTVVSAGGAYLVADYLFWGYGVEGYGEGRYGW